MSPFCFAVNLYWLSSEAHLVWGKRLPSSFKWFSGAMSLRGQRMRFDRCPVVLVSAILCIHWQYATMPWITLLAGSSRRSNYTIAEVNWVRSIKNTNTVKQIFKPNFLYFSSECQQLIDWNVAFRKSLKATINCKIPIVACYVHIHKVQQQESLN